MPRKSTTTVSQNKNGQYQVTIPRGLADGMNLAGAEVEWAVESGDRFSARVVSRDGGDDDE
jgi:sugar lactone lactonase YvrE